MKRLVVMALVSTALLAGCSSAVGKPTGATAPAGNRSAPAPVAAGNLLSTDPTLPTATLSETFAPPGLGARLSLPSSWVLSGSESGFRYSAHSPRHPYDFVLADTHTAGAPDASVLAANRTQQLESFSATIQAEATGTVDGLPAVRLRYLIGTGSEQAEDVEYDLLSGSDVILIVVGTPASRPDPALAGAIAASISA